MKRGLHGTYVSVEPFHLLYRYLDEQVFRFNKRLTTDADRFVQFCSSVAGKRLTWDELIGKGDSIRPRQGRGKRRVVRHLYTLGLAGRCWRLLESLVAAVHLWRGLILLRTESYNRLHVLFALNWIKG